MSIIFSISNISIFSQELSVVSWNLKDFGQSRDDNEIKLIAKEVRDVDIVAIQEVVAKHPGGAKAVARLADALNRMGSKWDYRISHPTNSSSSHKSERYAFLWKTSKVSLTGGRPYLISELASEVEREPYVASFLYQGKLLTVINYHACTHTNDFPERAEIQAISAWLAKNSSPNTLWVGDMNLVIDDYAFDHCKRLGFRAVLNGEKTSLKMKCKNGNYLSRAEDNILYKFSDFEFVDHTLVDFITDGNCNEVSWKRIRYSDHLGVCVQFRSI